MTTKKTYKVISPKAPNGYVLITAKNKKEARRKIGELLVKYGTKGFSYTLQSANDAPKGEEVS
jgi:hypothetical protein